MSAKEFEKPERAQDSGIAPSDPDGPGKTPGHYWITQDRVTLGIMIDPALIKSLNGESPTHKPDVQAI